MVVKGLLGLVHDILPQGGRLKFISIGGSTMLGLTMKHIHVKFISKFMLWMNLVNAWANQSRVLLMTNLPTHWLTSFTALRLQCLIVSLSIVDPMMYALLRAIDVNVGRPPWGGMSWTSPNKLRIPHPTKFNPLTTMNQRYLKGCLKWFLHAPSFFHDNILFQEGVRTKGLQQISVKIIIE